MSGKNEGGWTGFRLKEEEPEWLGGDGLYGRDLCCGLGGPKLCECGGGVWVRGWRVDVGVRGDATARLWLCDNSVCVCV